MLDQKAAVAIKNSFFLMNRAKNQKKVLLQEWRNRQPLKRILGKVCLALMMMEATRVAKVVVTKKRVTNKREETSEEKSEENK